MVFGDTSDNVDEVISPRFLFLSTSAPWTDIYNNNQFKTKNNEKDLFNDDDAGNDGCSIKFYRLQ